MRTKTEFRELLIDYLIVGIDCVRDYIARKRPSWLIVIKSPVFRYTVGFIDLIIIIMYTKALLWIV